MAEYNVPKFLKRDGDSLLFSGSPESYMVFYVPEIYFEREDAVIIGEFVNLIGILDYAIYNGPNDKSAKLRPFKFPTVFLTRPSSIEKVKGVKLSDSHDPDDFRLLKYKDGDQVVVSTKVPQSIVNVEEFYRLLLTGHLPTTIKYDEFQNYFIESMALNGNSYGMSLQLFGIIVSEMCRNKKNINEPFRYVKNMNDMTDYNAVSIKDIPKLVSPFVSITSENWDDSVVAAINSKEIKDSPMEKLLMT